MQRAAPGILIGGVLGSVVRWGLLEVGTPSLTPSQVVLLVNGIGAFLLGGVIACYPARHDPRRLASGVGFCGGLTTFSGLAVDLAGRLDAGELASSTGLAVAHLVVGVTGFLAARRIAA